MTPTNLFSARSLARLVIVFTLFVCVFLILPSASAEAVKGSARVLRTEGNRVSLLVNGANSDIKNGALLQQGSVILTGSGSSVDLLFENGVVLQIQQNSEFSIDKFLLDPFSAEGVNYKNLTNEPTTSVTQLKLDTGTVLASSKKLQEGSSFEILTPVGACGIRGTRFFVQSERVKNSPTAIVGVAEGLVEFSTPQGQTRQIAEGETLGITETAKGGSFTPNPPGAAELLPATNAIDAKLREAVPEKSFEGSEASKVKLSGSSDNLARQFDPQMVRVEGGKLPKGSAFYNQNVKTFEIGNYEVTWGEWKKVRDWAVGNGYDLQNVGMAPGGKYDMPVTKVSWIDAVKWCNAKSEMEKKEPVYRKNGKIFKTGDFTQEGSNALKIKNDAGGYRLPTQAEWEWAARGGKKSKGFMYSGSDDLDTVGWYAGNSGSDSKPVGEKKPNEIGIYDMSGNAAEWCEDLSEETGRRRNSGGNVDSAADATTVGSSANGLTGYRYYRTGFRVARSPRP